MENETCPELAYKKHVKYFLRFLNVLPPILSSHETTRLTMAFFAISGLDILDALSSLEKVSSYVGVPQIIEWIYHLQILPNEGDDEMSTCGFQGSSTLNIPLEQCNQHYKCGHITMTYLGLCSLLILDDDLSRVNKQAILQGVKCLQQPDGSFSATLSGTECDMRFLYCAACISYILDDWSGYDIEKATKYILDSISYDYGIGQGPELESHGGTTFCAIAALSLSNQLDKMTERQLEGLKRWLVCRQIDGFQGRPNKPVDTCYSFWIGATCKILGILDLTNFESNRSYVLNTQDSISGGFSKWPDTGSDPLHTYLGLGGLSLIGEKDLKEIMPSLNITIETYGKLKALHKKWRGDVE